MVRGREKLHEVLAQVPWPIGAALGVVAYLVIRYGFAWYLSEHGGRLGQGFAQQQSGVIALFGYIALGICWFGALLSFIGRDKRRRLLAAQTGLDSLSDISWRRFEMLVGEAFRRQDYAVEETGLGGADGGIDLILRKDGKTTLVQCKQWRTRQVKVNVVREMYGVMTHHHADAVKIVAIGNYTVDAERFARDKPIELIHGEALLAMVREAQIAAPSTASSAPSAVPLSPKILECPKCNTPMVRRANRRTGETFWGCANYPRCRGTPGD
ncbi:MAG: restriction endonuclease [Dokdonella sp.]